MGNNKDKVNPTQNHTLSLTWKSECQRFKIIVNKKRKNIKSQHLMPLISTVPTPLSLLHKQSQTKTKTMQKTNKTKTQTKKQQQTCGENKKWKYQRDLTLIKKKNTTIARLVWLSD